MLAHQIHDGGDRKRLSPAYASRELTEPIPRYELAEEGMDGSLAYQLIHDELQLDGNPALNLASFVTTWMEPEADKLISESLSRNFVDADEYPRTTDIQNSCVSTLADLFHSPQGVGCATVGSSEAIHLAGLAAKWRWRKRNESLGLPTTKPNIVMGANVQVCWEKFARYFEVEPRYVPLSEERFVLGVPEAMELVDHSTIAVVAILGSTYTGEYEPVKELASALDALASSGGPDVPIHVDAASGGFVAPFAQPDLEWDFRLGRVRSINVSGHKYGLVYPGVGWAIWATPEDLPSELIFHVNYLGGDQPTFNLNFSRGAAQIIAHYYYFLRLGSQGYVSVISALAETASYLSERIAAGGHFELLSKPDTLPVVCMRLRAGKHYSVFDVSAQLRARGWIVPAYTMAPDAADIAVLRIVVREGLSRDMADLLLADLDETIAHLEAQAPTPEPSGEEHKRHLARQAHRPAAAKVKGAPLRATHRSGGTTGVC